MWGHEGIPIMNMVYEIAQLTITVCFQTTIINNVFHLPLDLYRKLSLQNRLELSPTLIHSTRACAYARPGPRPWVRVQVPVPMFHCTDSTINSKKSYWLERKKMSSKSNLRVILGTMEVGRGALSDDAPVSQWEWALLVNNLYTGWTDHMVYTLCRAVKS